MPMVIVKCRVRNGVIPIHSDKWSTAARSLWINIIKNSFLVIQTNWIPQTASFLSFLHSRIVSFLVFLFCLGKHYHQLSIPLRSWVLCLWKIKNNAIYVKKKKIPTNKWINLILSKDTLYAIKFNFLYISLSARLIHVAMGQKVLIISEWKTMYWRYKI